MRVIRASARNAHWGHFAMSSSRLGGALAIITLVMAAARTAAAGGGQASSGGYGITLASSVVERYYPNSDTNAYPFRPANLNPNDVNFQDCEDNIHLVFNLLEKGGGSTDAPDILQVWAGTTDCSQTTARMGSESPLCWQVAPAQQFIENGSFDIYARSLTRYIGSTLDSVPNDGNPVVGAGQPESSCRTQTSSGQVALNLYFMFLSNTRDATPDAYFVYPINAALLGPRAPTGVLLADASSNLVVDWTPPVDPTVQGFEVYVADEAQSGRTADAAIPDDASASDACASGVLVDTLTRCVPSEGAGTVQIGISEVNDARYGAGDVAGNTSSNFTITALPGGGALVPGHRYVVAVAGYDDDGNVGLLSNVACESAGVSTGGSSPTSGGCALGIVGTPTTDSALGFGVCAALVALARRRRRAFAG
jgi:hypothetical protein